MLRRIGLFIEEAAWYFAGAEASLGADDDGAPDAAEAARRLNAWFAARGGFGASEVKADAYSGRCGLYATAAIGAGERYVSVPRSVVLDRASAVAAYPELASAEGAADDLIGTPAGARPSWLATTITLVARLALERRAGDASAFAPYVGSLPSPRDFAGHPLLWRRGGRGDAALRGTYLLEALEDQRASLRACVAAARACRPAALDDGGGFPSREDLAWAYLCWMTRCIGVVGGAGTDWAFVPVVDMTNCAWKADARCSRTLAEGPFATMRTPGRLDARAQIVENYGWANFDYAVRARRGAGRGRPHRRVARRSRTASPLTRIPTTRSSRDRAPSTRRAPRRSRSSRRSSARPPGTAPSRGGRGSPPTSTPRG